MHDHVCVGIMDLYKWNEGGCLERENSSFYYAGKLYCRRTCTKRLYEKYLNAAMHIFYEGDFNTNWGRIDIPRQAHQNEAVNWHLTETDRLDNVSNIEGQL